MARKRPTMKDVAARAGVGFKTVSRVVNGEPGVSEKTAEKVRRAADELHYHRDMIAGNLRRAEGRTDSLGLLLASVGNEFDAVMNRAVEDTAQEHRISVFTASTDEDPERERQLALGLLSRRVDGLVLMPSPGDLSSLQSEIDFGTPIVAVDRPAQGIDVDTVMSDNVGGARDAVAHLIAHGHRRAAVLTHLAPLPTTVERIAGARAAWESAGLPAEDLRIITDLTDDEATARAVLGLLDGEAPPTAVFAARNRLATGTVRALQQRGLQHQVAVVGFDDFEHADLFDPSVTVVGQDPARLGRLAAERLIARLEDPTLPVEVQVIATQLILRRSCGCEG
ncbi:LacI family DNA-binding transcriptional regulator [Brachybacterium sp. DNPG3]